MSATWCLSVILEIGFEEITSLTFGSMHKLNHCNRHNYRNKTYWCEFKAANPSDVRVRDGG